MKNIVSCFVLFALLASCNSKKSGNMVVNGTIEGLKKGTIYLQKVKDSALFAVDSVQLDGNSTFILSDDIAEPEVYFLTLDKKEDEKIAFFGEKGEIFINSKLEKLATSVKISGSKNQEILNSYYEMLQKFRGKELDFFKSKFEAQQSKNDTLFLNLQKEEANLIKRKYYYTTNFAIQNKDNEVGPYIALTELYNANIKLLDTVNNSLSAEMKSSKYGKKLNEFIKTIKENEN